MSSSIAMHTEKARSPWAVWGLSVITLGVYYLVWYVRLNKQIARAVGVDVTVRSTRLWLSQCLPIVSWISLARTARRLRAALECAGAEPSVSAGKAILASLLLGSHTWYLQRHANELWQALERLTVAPEGDPFDLLYAYSLGPRALTAASEPREARHRA